MYFFFFSSRRRHTRFDCDWSSDVCSSDLGHGEAWGPTTSMEQTARRVVEITCKSTTRLRASRISRDRKSTRLNSSHSQISYAVFCLKKKKTTTTMTDISLLTTLTVCIHVQ